MAGNRLSYAEIKRRYVDRERPLPEAIELALRRDAGASARAILRAVERRRREHRCEGQRLRGILRFERALWATGVVRVAGVDEAGMSPLAGPVAAGAVIFPPGFRLPGVDDSKKLDAKERERLAPLIREAAVASAVAFVEPDEIDRVNIYWAGLLAMRRAIEALASIPSTFSSTAASSATFPSRSSASTTATKESEAACEPSDPLTKALRGLHRSRREPP